MITFNSIILLSILFTCYSSQHSIRNNFRQYKHHAKHHHHHHHHVLFSNNTKFIPFESYHDFHQKHHLYFYPSDNQRHHLRHHAFRSVQDYNGIVDEEELEQQVDIAWPVKKEAVTEGNLVLGGLMMVHEREDSITCGPIMPQGGIQALEAMLYTLDRINSDPYLLPNITLGAHILDDCDKDTYGLEMAVDFIKG